MRKSHFNANAAGKKRRNHSIRKLRINVIGIRKHRGQSSIHAETERKKVRLLIDFSSGAFRLAENFWKMMADTFCQKSENNMRSSHETLFFFYGKRWNFHLFVLRPLRSFDCNKKKLIFKLIITHSGLGSCYFMLFWIRRTLSIDFYRDSVTHFELFSWKLCLDFHASPHFSLWLEIHPQGKLMSSWVI